MHTQTLDCSLLNDNKRTGPHLLNLLPSYIQNQPIITLFKRNLRTAVVQPGGTDS